MPKKSAVGTEQRVMNVSRKTPQISERSSEAILAIYLHNMRIQQDETLPLLLSMLARYGVLSIAIAVALSRLITGKWFSFYILVGTVIVVPMIGELLRDWRRLRTGKTSVDEIASKLYRNPKSMKDVWINAAAGVVVISLYILVFAVIPSDSSELYIGLLFMSPIALHQLFVSLWVLKKNKARSAGPSEPDKPTAPDNRRRVPMVSLFER
jgi:hypothetical protein